LQTKPAFFSIFRVSPAPLDRSNALDANFGEAKPSEKALEWNPFSERPTPVALRQFRTLRIDGCSVQPSFLPPTPKISEGPALASDEPEPLSPPSENDSPAARAQKAKLRLRRLFETAWHKAKGQARLCRSEEYEILRCAYRAVRAWQSSGIQEEIERELRDEAAVAISRQSKLFLVLIRCALPYLRSNPSCTAALASVVKQAHLSCSHQD
jgi:hypothetical protein